MTSSGYYKIEDFFNKHNQAKTGLLSVHRRLVNGVFKNSQEITTKIPNSSLINDDKVVFRIKWNEYRMIIYFNFSIQAFNILFVGTHKEYDKWNARR
tara:strand:+ start:31518 stop:31808 length:291 start_codon:yes stop_codon:yes gene_type:complete